jgi:hypothetical protein
MDVHITHLGPARLERLPKVEPHVQGVEPPDLPGATGRVCFDDRARTCTRGFKSLVLGAPVLPRITFRLTPTKNITLRFFPAFGLSRLYPGSRFLG